VAHPVYRLAATDIAPTRDLSPAGTLHAYTDGVGTTVCGLELGRQVRLFPDSLWEERGPGRHCPVCADRVEPGG
jgi:hypothetical protein